jgi:hypothetical protein
MSSVAMSGDDTAILNNHVFNDLADGDCIAITFPTEKANLKTGKNGNTIFGLNEGGKQCEMVLRVIRGSQDDKFLNQLSSDQDADFAGFVTMQGEFIKKVGDGAGNRTSDTYIVSGGVFNKNVEAKSNVEGDTEQSVSIYHLKFSKGTRVLT